MSSSYVGETPSLTIDPRIPKFFEAFYATSDNPSEAAHNEYADSFTKTANFVMGTRKADGYDQILEVRKGLWSGPIKTRKHTLKKIFPFGDNSNELMLYGTVDYGLKNGKSLTVDWAGRALMMEEKGKLKLGFYQVYLVGATCISLIPAALLTCLLGFCTGGQCCERLRLAFCDDRTPMVNSGFRSPPINGESPAAAVSLPWHLVQCTSLSSDFVSSITEWP